MRIQRQWVSIHELFELLVDCTVLPVPVMVGKVLEDAELVGDKTTVTVDTPAVMAERADAAVLEDSVSVTLAQNPLYQFCSNWRSLWAVQNASQVPSGEMRSWARRLDWQKQLS
jgi:hypothetical protein